MSDPAARTCPACRAELRSVEHEGVHLDQCPRGCGVWLDRGELRAVVDAELADQAPAAETAAVDAAHADCGGAVVAESTGARRPCAVCGRDMRLCEYPGSGVPIDECDEHGTWLDDGELERIEAYAEGMRRQVTEGAAGDRARGATGRPVAGIALPRELLTTLGSLRRGASHSD